MVTDYFMDAVDIVNIVNDEWGVPTETIIPLVPARVEDKNELVKNKDGQEVNSNTFVMLAYDTVIDYTSKIIIRKKAGVTFTNDLRMAILKMGVAVGFEASHLEVWL